MLLTCVFQKSENAFVPKPVPVPAAVESSDEDSSEEEEEEVLIVFICFLTVISSMLCI